MKAQELRIGNLVNDSIGRITKVDSIKTLTRIITINGNPEQWFKPILLTEEWILKFGFKRLRDGRYVIGKIKKPHWEYDLALFYHKDFGFYQKSPTKPVKYVHKLQNLYFALNDKELIVKKL